MKIIDYQCMCTDISENSLIHFKKVSYRYLFSFLINMIS